MSLPLRAEQGQGAEAAEYQRAKCRGQCMPLDADGPKAYLHRVC